MNRKDLSLSYFLILVVQKLDMVSLGLPILIKVTLGLPIPGCQFKKYISEVTFGLLMKEGPGQKPIKINADLWTELNKWLKTDNAKKIGYYSKAQFATEAIRGLLIKRQFELYLQNSVYSKNDIEFIINKIPKIVKLEINSIDELLKNY